MENCYLCARPIRAENRLLQRAIDPENGRVGHAACIRIRAENDATIEQFAEWLKLIRGE